MDMDMTKERKEKARPRTMKKKGNERECNGKEKARNAMTCN
jgi:hypothetical protein